MNVSACLVTRGDVDMQPILDSLPKEWERVIWNNGAGRVTIGGGDIPWSLHQAIYPQAHPSMRVQDLAVYGRYAAIEYATHDLIYVADDDVIVSDPQAIVSAWEMAALERNGWRSDSIDTQHVVCNMPPEFRHAFYEHHALVGFGACFHRSAADRAFASAVIPGKPGDSGGPTVLRNLVSPSFNRTCDIVFMGLTDRVLVDVPKENLPWADGDNRMYRDPRHVEERTRMLDLVRQVRDAR